MNERDIFIEALRQGEAADRRAVLAQACAGDDALRRRVEALLLVHDRAGSFLEQPVVEAAGTGDYDPATPDGLAAAGLREVPRERPGTMVGPYKLVERIGEGGMGTVWLAQQAEPVKRLVAVKLVKAGMDSQQVVARFEAERQALALMDHPNIARVLDGGTVGPASRAGLPESPARLAGPTGRPYFVMELVKGVPITRYCDEHRLTPRQRLELFIPVCQAIQHAHQKGIIHRDLKPSNVLVALYDGRPVPKVIDFGVAKATGQALTDKTLVTGFGAIVGTLEYMSPEQAELNNHDIDTRVDVYALGVLLYELLTGGAPFSRQTTAKGGLLETLRVIREQEPTRPSTKLSTAEGLPALAASRGTEPAKLTRLMRRELDWIVLKALEKDRARRYETASAFAADVGRYLADEPVLACPPSLSYRLQKFARRNKGPVLSASLLVIVFICGLIGTTWGMFRAADEAGLKQDALTDARDKLFEALVHRARAERSSGRVGQRFAALKAIREAAQIRVTPELRTEATAALVLPDVEVAHEWEAWAEGAAYLDFDASFDRYARLDLEGGITVCRRTEGGEEILIRLPARGKPMFTGPWMSPDGRYVAVGQGTLLGGVCLKELLVWTIDGAASQEPLVVPEVTYVGALSYRHDRRQLAIGHRGGSVSVYDLESRTRLHRLEIGVPLRRLAFHPSDGRLAVAAGSAVRLFDVDSGKELPALLPTTPPTEVNRLCWHPDGRRLAVACADAKIHLWDTRTAREVLSPCVTGDYTESLSFNPAGDLLVSRSSYGGFPRIWDVATGRRLLAPPSDFGDRFSPDGCLLGWSWQGKKVRLWRVADGRALRVFRRRLAAGTESLVNAVLHADGRTLAAASNHWLSFFDVARGEELASVPCPHEAAFRPVFHGTEGWVTGGHGGMLVWPTRRDPEANVLRVGPPRFLRADSGGGFSNGTGVSTDGRVLAVPRGDSTLLLRRGRPDLVLGPQADVRFAAVSPKGEWVVTGIHWSHGRSSASVWDAETGRRVAELPVRGSTPVRFSPDGRWLVTNTDGDPRLWEAGTWREVRRLVGQACFSPDSRLLAVRDGMSGVRLEETVSGREVACLTGPEPGLHLPDCFTPDGERLIVGGNTAPLNVWDLRLIRAQLKQLGLDWDWPEFAPQGPGSEARLPQVEVTLGDLAKSLLTREQREREAIERYRREVEANPDDPRLLNNLAWHYLNAPEPLRDVNAAVPLAEKAFRLAPKPVAANTLGLAYYRAGLYREAMAVLRQNLDRQSDASLGSDLFILAMCYQQLEEPDRARDYFDWAARWTRTHRGKSAADLEDMAAIRAEAEQRLGVTKSK